jgi:hypothetical protein
MEGRLMSIKIGDEVYISKSDETSSHYGWDEPMDKYINTMQIVSSRSGDSIRLDGIPTYTWHVRDLILAEELDTKIPISMKGKKCLFDPNELNLVGS